MNRYTPINNFIMNISIDNFCGNLVDECCPKWSNTCWFVDDKVQAKRLESSHQHLIYISQVSLCWNIFSKWFCFILSKLNLKDWWIFQNCHETKIGSILKPKFVTTIVYKHQCNFWKHYFMSYKFIKKYTNISLNMNSSREIWC